MATPVFVHRPDIDRIEPLPDTEQEDPHTMKAISTENATLISTTSGMPRAPVAARLIPFSSDMNATT